MESSRFAHLRQRDNSVSMLRVKMSRRRSQVQKENRERVVNTRRQLRALQELDISSLDASMTLANMSVAPEKKLNAGLPKNVAGEERLKQLQRWKERKALEKEKEKRDKAGKGVFKTGRYHPKDCLSVEPLPHVPHGRAKEMKTVLVQSTRVTRSMKQQVEQKPLKVQDVNTAKKSQPSVERTTRLRGAAPKLAPSQNKTKEPVPRGSSVRSTHKPHVTAAPVLKDKPKDKCTDVHSTRSKILEVQPHPTENKPSVLAEENISKSFPVSSEETFAVTQTVAEPCSSEIIQNSLDKAASFAPEGFLFQAPLGLSSFKFDPMTPRSADAFLTPSSSFTLPSAPVFDDEPKTEMEPSVKSPHRSPPAPSTETTVESKQDVPYFRSEIQNETDRLTGLCARWESNVEDESIPEEMRDRMRTAVGQARLLMKERFKQFSGLVDDCEFNRGEKITTCSDLQGFWDMVYFQVEDVNKKFDALKEAEGRGWKEEVKVLPRQRKVVKKPTSVASKSEGAKAAAKSRLAAVKAAMKAKQQAALTETSSEDAPSHTELMDENQFKVNSPVSVRRSIRLSALPQQSPCSNSVTPRRRTRRSLALTPAQINANPQQTTSSQHPVNTTPAQAAAPPQPENMVSVKESSSDVTEQNEDSVSDPGQSISSVIKQQQKPAEDLSGHFSPSLCKKPVECPAPVFSQSFSPLSCTVTFTPQSAQSLRGAERSVEATPDSCAIEDIPAVDFERYLQPSQRESLSPRQPFTVGSPMVMDVEMESPEGQDEDPTLQETVSTLLSVPTLVSSESPQTAESALLLFTSDMENRIRQSVCPSDLMVFTPPHL